MVSVYVDRERRDKRMVEMRKQLEEAGVRVMLADHARLSGMVSREIPHQGIVAMAREIETGMSFDELMDRVSTWQYEFLDDTEVRGAYREQMTKDMEVIDGILERMGWREGRHLGTPTVKQMIKILSKLPEDYRITCCGAENYLYVFASSKCITIDNEQYLDC